MAPLALSAKVDALTLSDPERPTANFVALVPPRPDASVVNATAAGQLAASNVKLDAQEVKSKVKMANKVFRCTFPGCGREFQLKGNLKRHANIHCGDKKFACKFCGKKFLRKADMEVHYRVHTGEKPYRCKYQECGKCFARRSDLLSHERTHTGRKPFACPFPGCDRSFARKFDLHKHQRLHENQPGVSVKTKTMTKTKKRRLSPVKAVATPLPAKKEEGSCDCPSDVSAAFDGSIANPEPALTAEVMLPEPPIAQTTVVPPTTGCIGARFKMSPTTSACLDAPRPLRYELKCPENHIHSPPACFAALTSLDALMLSQETLDLSRPLGLGLDAFPPHRPSTSVASSCCPAHLELRPPPPEGHASPATRTVFSEPDILDQLFTTFQPTNTTIVASSGVGTSLGAMPSNPTAATAITDFQSATPNTTVPGPVVSTPTTQTLSEPSLSMLSPDGSGLCAAPNSSVLLNLATTTTASICSTPLAPTSPVDPVTPLTAVAAASVNFGSSPVSTTTDEDQSGSVSGSPAVTPGKNKRSAEKACLTTPTSSLLDYSSHKRGCGHLSIQHGNHHDYVVQNHLVCQDSVTSLGALQLSPSSTTENNSASAISRQCASPQDTHRPGCGHLPVRHKDHIDYVVEDNLICQQASWLEDDNLELLGDDFWDFYGAIDAFPTN